MKRACPQENEACPYFEKSCYSDVHHRFFPRRDYRRGIEREFRELPENKEQLCRWEHDEIHYNEEPPEKPSREVMLQALGRSAMKEAS